MSSEVETSHLTHLILKLITYEISPFRKIQQNESFSCRDDKCTGVVFFEVTNNNELETENINEL